MLEELNLSNNNNTVKARIINDLIRGLIVILSSILYSLSVVILLEPAHVISVGLSATSQILSKTLSFTDTAKILAGSTVISISHKVIIMDNLGYFS